MLIVQKFGGTSVGDIARIKNAAKKVKAELDRKNKVIVVVSAMSGITNQMVDYCNQVSSLMSQESLAEYDSIRASGEQVTCGLLALELQTNGYKARSFLGWNTCFFFRKICKNRTTFLVGLIKLKIFFL